MEISVKDRPPVEAVLHKHGIAGHLGSVELQELIGELNDLVEGKPKAKVSRRSSATPTAKSEGES